MLVRSQSALAEIESPKVTAKVAALEMAAATCAVCREHVFKYRCSRCKTPSCSLPCFKSHHSDCSIANDSAPVGLLGGGYEADAGKNGQGAKTSEQQLDQLFGDHPGLKANLRTIYETSLDPASLPGKDFHERGPGRQSLWTEEKGFSHALKRLQAQIQDPETMSTEIRAFISFVNDGKASES